MPITRHFGIIGSNGRLSYAMASAAMKARLVGPASLTFSSRSEAHGKDTIARLTGSGAGFPTPLTQATMAYAVEQGLLQKFGPQAAKSVVAENQSVAGGRSG